MLESGDIVSISLTSALELSEWQLHVPALYPRGKSPVPTGLEPGGPRAGLDAVKKK
jgi:hypothetical protein